MTEEGQVCPFFNGKCYETKCGIWNFSEEQCSIKTLAHKLTEMTTHVKALLEVKTT